MISCGLGSPRKRATSKPDVDQRSFYPRVLTTRRWDWRCAVPSPVEPRGIHSKFSSPKELGSLASSSPTKSRASIGAFAEQDGFRVYQWRLWTTFLRSSKPFLADRELFPGGISFSMRVSSTRARNLREPAVGVALWGPQRYTHNV